MEIEMRRERRATKRPQPRFPAVISFSRRSASHEHELGPGFVDAGLFRETRPEHRRFAFGLLLGGLVLKHIPVLLQNSVLDAQDVGGNPIR